MLKVIIRTKCVANLQRRNVKLVMWKIGFLPHLSTSCPKVRELMMVPTYVAEITHGPRTFWKEIDGRGYLGVGRAYLHLSRATGVVLTGSRCNSDDSC